MWDPLAPDLCRVAISNVVWDPLAPDLCRVAISKVVWDPLAPDLCRVGRAVRDWGKRLKRKEFSCTTRIQIQITRSLFNAIRLFLKPPDHFSPDHYWKPPDHF